jgi:5-formyltetrahydrofolate cyclo-ligase
VDPAAREIAAEKAAEHFASSELFQKSQHIACYFAQPSEFSADPIIKKIWDAQKKCYLHKLATEKENELEFVEYQVDDVLRLNRYKIL